MVGMVRLQDNIAPASHQIRSFGSMATKDGPSAGVTMATALASLLTDRRGRPFTALTGEITLSGNVLPIGGIQEKKLAAKRAGVKDIILPEDNRQNVQEDLTPEQLQGLTMHYVKSIPELLAIALPTTPADENHDAEVREQLLTGAPGA